MRLTLFITDKALLMTKKALSVIRLTFSATSKAILIIRLTLFITNKA